MAISTIAMVLIATFTLSLAAIPAANAQRPIRNKMTYAFCTVIPNPVGVGQEVLIWVGISDYLSIHTDGWEGLTVTVTKPDNTSETLGPFRTDATGSTGTLYIPTMIGTYYFQTHFPAQWYNWTQADVYYEASDSERFALTVQETPIPYYQGTPLPSEYWIRPINAQNREWYTISGNWLWGAALDNYPYWNWVADNNEDAPESGHILWAKPLTIGGLAGGSLGPHAFDFGDAYEGYFLNSVIIGGVLYYNRFQADGGTRVEQEVVAVNLKTGEELWVKNWNNTRLAFGQVFYWDSFNVHGAYAYLWTTVGSTWNAFDPATGRWVFGIKNVPSGSTPIYGPSGEILVYTVNMANGWMTLWNSTLVVTADRTASNQGSWIRGDKGLVLDGAKGIQWNKTIPRGLPGRVLSVLEDRVLGGTDDAWSTHLAILRGDWSQVFWALDLKPGREGQLLFNVTWNPPVNQAGNAFIGASVTESIFVVGLQSTRQLVALSLDTGSQLWGPTEPQLPVDIFTIANWRRGVTSITEGKVISGGMGGRVHAYSAQTGQLLWTYDAEDQFNEILWGHNWPLYLSFIAGGKIYLNHAEHSPVDPMPRGAPYICLDLETGREIWNISIRGVHWGGYPIIGDSTIAMFNAYDNRIHAIGKGPSAITVTAPDVSVELGRSVLIKGTVTDVSPGTEDYALRARFPNGVPAVSDESISDWMEYVYTQSSRPTDAVGVSVIIDVIDANGNYRNIGTATSDASGVYSFEWKPDISGKYTVFATFAGSNSYYASHSQTAFIVDDAATKGVEEPTVTAPPTEMYFAISTIAIILAIAIVGAILALLLRKRP